MGEKAFRFEIQFWLSVATLLSWLEDRLEALEWQLSPSRGYELLADLVEKLREQGYPALDQPAFEFLAERLRGRADELRGTEVDFALAMDLKRRWRDRIEPVPGGMNSTLQIFDWFLPCLRRIESAGWQAMSERSTALEHVTQGEAVKLLLLAVDWLSKDRHFQDRNAWGWFVPFPWADFIRDEIFDWSKKFPTSVEPVPPSSSVAFSVPG